LFQGFTSLLALTDRVVCVVQSFAGAIFERTYIMYAVIRTGGKQYRVAPGDVLKVEKVAANEDGAVEFGEVLAFSGEAGSVVKPAAGAKVLASVVSEGRGEKILVFHYKRKKQYKKMQGHRQSFTQIKINEILVDGKSYSTQA
jgi:large subunit ribosomal protein L21